MIDTFSSGSQTAKQTQSKLTKAEFVEIEKYIYTHWTTAKHLPSDIATLSVFDYAERLIQKNPVHQTEGRREEFRTLLKRKIASLLGDEVATSVYNQLATNHTIATAQHFTPLTTHILNPTVTMALSYLGRKEVERQNLLVLACAGISFNNGSQGYARDHGFHSLVGDTIMQHHLNFVGRAHDSEPVILADAYDTALKKSWEKLLLHYRSEKIVKKREFKLLMSLMKDTFFTTEVLSQKRFIDQITLTNFYLWKKAFASYQGNVPNLIFLAQEDVAKELLLEFHISQDTLLHKALFDTKWHELIYKYFNNIMCAFSVERQYGTFLFWATPHNSKQRIQLFAKDGVLESPDKKIRHPLTPEHIQQALEQNEIMPGTMLTFLVLSMYYGYNLLGGLRQPTYLEQTKQAYMGMLQELGLFEEAKNCEQTIVNSIINSRPSLLFLDGPENQRVPASILDLLLHGQKDSVQRIFDVSKQITMKELFYRLYPDLYRNFSGDAQKDPRLLAITEQDIELYTGINKKISPWGILSNQ